MLRFRSGVSMIIGIILIIVPVNKLYNYNLIYHNWTYQTNPMEGEIFGFDNTKDYGGELKAIRQAAKTWNDCGVNFSFPRIKKGKRGTFNGIDYNDNQNQIGWQDPWPFPKNWPAFSFWHEESDGTPYMDDVWIHDPDYYDPCPNKRFSIAQWKVYYESCHTGTCYCTIIYAGYASNPQAQAAYNEFRARGGTYYGERPRDRNRWREY